MKIENAVIGRTVIITGCRSSPNEDHNLCRTCGPIKKSQCDADGKWIIESKALDADFPTIRINKIHNGKTLIKVKYHFNVEYPNQYVERMTSI